MVRPRGRAFIDEVRAHRDGGSSSEVQRAVTPAPSVRAGKRKFYIPYFSDHAYAFSGALRYVGHDAVVLPPPDEESLRKGEKHSSGKECHPYAILAGDLVTLAQSLPGDRTDAVFFFPGTSVPCLLPQYGPGHRLILERIGVDRLDIVTPSTAEMVDLFGVQGGYRLWRGLTAIDLLVKAVYRLRPYERVKGTVDAIQEDNLRDLEHAVEGGDILETTQRCITRLQSTPIYEEAWGNSHRPVIGVAGDIYTRGNRFANLDLFEQLEEMGCEVWPSPFFVDVFNFGIRRDLQRSIDRRSPAEFFQKGSLLLLKEIGEQRIVRLFREKFRYMEEPDYETVKHLAAPYVGERGNHILMLRVRAKIISQNSRPDFGQI